MIRAALCASRLEFFLGGGRVSPGLECGGQKVRNSPRVDPMIIPFLGSITALMGAVRDVHCV